MVVEQEHWIKNTGGRLFAKSWTPNEQTSHVPILLFHDSLGCVSLWREFPNLLSQVLARRVIAFDRLGFGRSSARNDKLAKNFVGQEAEENVPLVCSSLGVDAFVACGHSVGGGMAVETAAALPGRCAAVVTMAAQAFVEDRTLDGIRRARIAFAQPDNIARLTKYHGDKARWVLSAWIDTWLAPEFADWSLEPALGRISCPLLAIHGERDEYGSMEHPRRIARGRGEVLALPDIGHNPHRESPALLVDAIRQFLASESIV